jgi:hypothetical protein
MSDEFGNPEIRDAIRDLCLAVAELAVGVVHEIGTNRVQSVLDKAERLSALMDHEDRLFNEGFDR